MPPVAYPAFFARETSATWWKLPLLAAISWGLAVIITFCAACQSVMPLLYMLPLGLIVLYGIAAATSLHILVNNWKALHGVSFTEMYLPEMTSIIAPLLYAAVWLVGMLLATWTFINYNWPLNAVAAVSTFFAA